ncbi:MAG: aminoglycoside phosphotransferase family protein [Bacteroidetes bacterium]|nr:aminoglycoside phosphotransferase family protein [Bacteroidota bacterium]
MAQIHSVLSALDILAVPLSAKNILIIAFHDKVFNSSYHIKKYEEVHLCKLEEDGYKIYRPKGCDHKYFSYDKEEFILPFENCSFDKIVLDLAFDDYGKYLNARNNRIIKNSNFINRELLCNQSYRVLKKNGVFLQIIINKLSINYIKNKLDYIINNKNLYNLSALNYLTCNLLKKTFFLINSLFKEKQKFKWANIYLFKTNIEGVNEIIDYDKFKHNNTIKPNVTIKQYIKDSLFYKRFFSDCYCKVKYRSKNHQTLYELIFSDIKRNLNCGLVDDSIFCITEKGVICVRSKNYIIKIALNDLSSSQLYKNFVGIKHIHSQLNISKEIHEIVPENVYQGNVLGSDINYYVEELKPGKPASSYSNTVFEYDIILENSIKAVHKIHLYTKKDRLDNEFIGSYILERITFLDTIVNNEYNVVIKKIYQYLIDYFENNNIPSVFQKGDCSASNVLVDESLSVSAIIDWDQNNTEGLPLIDIINLLESFKRHNLNKGMGFILVEYILPRKFNDIEKRLIGEYCSDLKLPEDLFKPISILYWLEHIFAQKNVLLSENNSWITNNIFYVLDYMKSSFLD